MKVLVLTIEGLQLGFLGCYGNEWIATPHLDQLATEGVVFDRHIADHPSPAGARHAWRTGSYRFPLASSPEPTGGPDAPDLVRCLRRGGIKTTLISHGDRMPSEAFDADWEQVLSLPDQKLPKAIAKALKGPANGLVWVELATLRPPWEVSDEPSEDPDRDADEGEDEPLTPLADPAFGVVDPEDDRLFLRLQRGYASAVTGIDDLLGELLDELRDRDLLDDVLLVLTTDHGLPLGEHGVVGDVRPWLYEELVHLPLLFRLPGGAEAGRRLSALTQPVDLLPTLLDAFGLPVPAVHGRSVLPLVNGEQKAIRDYACSGLRIGDAVELALRTHDWAYLLPLPTANGERPRSPQLYVKPDDRWEVNNLLQHHLDFADHLEATLRAFAIATGQPGPLQAPVLRLIEEEATNIEVTPRTPA